MIDEWAAARNAENFTCNTCGLAFQQADYQRDHMKTEWHRYNLKRRVAGLPPIPSEVFAEKVLNQQTEEKPQKQRQVTKKDLKRMEKERKRLENVSRASSLTSAMSDFSLGEPTPQEYNSEDEEPLDPEEAAIQLKLSNRVEIPPNVCFMDGHESATVEDNVKYLELKYGMVVPEREYVSDLAGLITYLNEKVGLGNCCLYCSYMGRSVEAARAHMSDKQHCKIPYDTEAHKDELEEWYDFSSSYSNAEDDGWEDTDEEGEGQIVVREDDLDDRNMYSSGYELEVAPGIVAGHRDLRQYYKQRHTFQPKLSEGRKAVKMIDLRSPGVSEKAAERMVKQTWKQSKRAEYSRFKHDKHVNFQKHFRDELLQ